MHASFGLLTYLSISLVLALVFGLITQRMRLSPIVGYLLAGVAIGSQTLGFVGDPQIASQFAEIGVVLLMFGVGLHFNLSELLAVRRIAVPGALAQLVIATGLVVLATTMTDLEMTAGLVMGIAVSVASTVVVVRVLMENDALHTSQGHIAIGWLIVQDILTVLVLVVMPALGSLQGEAGGESPSVLMTLGTAIAKVITLGLVVVVGGRKVIPWLLRIVVRSRSRELFTLTVLALALAIATGSAVVFGVSMALGAFLAGMVVGQTEVSHQAAADALPMRDAFAVLFFVSVGMLFDPQVVMARPGLLLLLLTIVLVVNPLTAFAIAWFLRYSVRTALTLGFLLSQIGEFSFLLADQAVRDKLLPDECRSLLVTCAIVTISLNPLLFRLIVPLELWLRRRPRLWRLLSQRSEASGQDLNRMTQSRIEGAATEEQAAPTSAVIVGYGPVGQTASRILIEFGVRPIVIDLNLDTVRRLNDAGKMAVYGDATQREILEVAGIMQAKYLLLTIPEVMVRTMVIITAKQLNPELRVFARARYIQEQAWLEDVGATGVVTEEGETAVGLAAVLLREVGADEARIQREIVRIHAELRPHREDSAAV